MINRREFVIALGATGLLAACQEGPPQPSTVVLNFAGKPGMNLGPGGEERPVTVLIMRLKSTGAFNSADYFALQGDAAKALGADLLGQRSDFGRPRRDGLQDDHGRTGSGGHRPGRTGARTDGQEVADDEIRLAGIAADGECNFGQRRNLRLAARKMAWTMQDQAA